YTRGQGAYIAVEGDLAVVGAALAGDSTIYRRAAEGWREELVVPFGARVATDGQHVVVGSCGFTAQVTVLHQDPQEGWISQQLTRPLNAVSGFGCALAIEGGLLVVGASGGNHGGEVYTYRLQADGRWQMTERIFNPNREAGDLFGAALALDGDRLFIGAPSEDEIAFMSGAVHLMRHTPEGWREAALLTASDAEGRDAFGASIDLWQDTLIVGAPAKADDGVDAGAAYIFTNADGLWQQRARLRPLDLRANEDFGSAVAVRNAAAVVGAPGFGAGRALRFVADAAGEWRLDAQLVSPHAGGAEFGEAVALARETFIGEPGNNTHGADHGGVWVYNAGVAVCSVDGACACVAGAAGEGCAERPDCGDGVRQLAEGCDDGNQAPGDGCDADCTPETGWDCANDAACAPICGDAEQHGDEACDDGNTVFLDGCADCRIAIGDGCDAVCDPVGTHGRFEPVITSIAGAGAFDDVGRTVATDGIYTAVGVSNHRGDGAVFMFHRDVDGEWLQGETVTIAEGASAFGTAVALHETTLVASDDASRFGVVYLFALNAAGEWQRRDAIAGPEDARYFGRSLVFDGTDLIVGGNIAAGAGRLYRYTRRDGVWHLVERIDAPGGGTSRAFGATLALDAKTLLVSDEAVTGVHVYRLDPDASRRTQTLSDVHATAGDAFGHSLAISADAALIGAPYADDQVNDSGVVHLFVREAGGQWRSAQRIRPIIDNVRINFGSGVALRHGRAIITSTFAANRFALVAPDRLALVDRLTHNDFRSSAAHGVAIGEQAAVVGRPSGRRMHFVNFDEQTPVCAQDGACVCHLGAGGDDCATRPACGDGLVQPSEACDDGNQAPGDGCGPTCRFECGDGVLAANEGCDDGNRVANDGCGPTCELEGCGNGVVDPGEACDDGNLVPGDGCDADCVNERCGDGVLNVGEGCDDGNLEPGDGCSAQCQVLLCGNGVIDADEACDDGNPEVGDGCNAQCAIEACGNASLDLGEACDDGNAVPGDGCSPACTLEVCGSGYADPGEPCDDANADPFDGCHACQSLLPSLCAQACDPGGTVGTPDAVARLSRVGPALQGTAVAIAGDRAVTVGQSVVQAFERNEAGGWRFTQQVETDDQLARAYTAAMTRTHLALAYYQSNIVHIFRLEDGVWQQTQTLQQDTGNFGWAMAFEGRRLVIGAPRARSSRGDVYVYDEGADGQWRQSARLQRQAASAQFGYSVAVRGARILVGAPYNSEGLSRAGRMFIYQQRPAGDFVVEDTLVLPDQRFSEYFGLNAAFSDRFVVGTTGHSLGIFERDAQQRWVFRERPAGIPSGARLALRDEQIFVSSASRSEVDILERQADGTWPTIRTIDAPVAGARFGVSLALSGRALLVGASNETGQLRIQGAAYVFDLREPACFADGECPCLDGAAGVDCAQRPRCGDGNVDPAEGCDDGGGVAGDGCDAQCAVEPGWTCAEVCAPLCGDGQLVGDEECDDANDIAMDGCDACRHIRGDLCQDTCDSVGAQRRWRSQPVIVNSGGPSDRMGHTVAIDGDTVVLGSVGNAAGENRGTAVVLQRDAEGQYVEQQFIEDPRIDAAGDRGLTVAIDDDWLMLGAAGDDGSSGAVYVYSKDEAGVWQHTQRLFAPDAIESGRFGEFLVIREGWALIGATQKAGPRRASAGYLYRLEAGEWTLATRFSLEGGLINPSAVALSAEQAFVSSRYDDQVWVFDLLDLDWRVDQVITNEGGGYFGHSLATDGETLVVGATQGQVEGAVYVYRRNAEGQWTLNDRLTSPDGPREFFGHAVAVEGRHLMVATRSSHGFSTAHHFTRSTQGWSARQAFELDDSGRSDAIGLQADRLVLGVPRTARLPTAAKVFEAESLCGSDGLCVCVEGAAGAQCGQRPSCGDGAWQSAEACEDGNQDAGDGCDGLCSLE
ncbi:MAG: cysteine-rich repeat protein, partial [Bradymonadia bacterium]